MFKFLKSKSLAFTSSFVLSILFIAVIGSMITLSIRDQKAAYFQQFEQYGTVFTALMQAKGDLVAETTNAIAQNQPLTGHAFDELLVDLNAMVGNDIVAGAYLLTPDKIERDGKTYLYNSQYAHATSETESLLGQEYELSAIFEAGFDQAMKNGFVLTEDYTDSFGTFISYLAPIKDQSGKPVALFGVDFDYGKVKASINRILWTNIIVGLIFTIAAIVISIVLVRLAVRPLKRLAEVSHIAAQGDLTVEIPNGSNNEIGRATNAFNDMVRSLRELTHSIRHTSGEVSDASVNLQESAQQTAHATEEITNAIQNIAAGLDEQLQHFRDSQRAMDEMIIGIGRIAESSSIVSELAADTAGSANLGQADMESTVVQMQAIEQNLHKSVDTMHELRQLSNRIGEMIALIGEVANQTNLLALNASIEAARAGEHGKGFAVVAQEIRKLAERSKTSSEQIADILQGISERTGEAVGSLEQSMAEAQTGTIVANKAGDTFKAIVQSIRQVSEQVGEVSAASEQMSAGSEHVAVSLNNVERIASNSSMDSARVAAASEEQLASMQEVAGFSEQLRNMASSLKETIGKFRV
ncbi:methyl-accepting chemotaxis protein [Paenibacillus methanolicus]|uniref:Methyl-accepting chemotaxis protein n=1 Tax=Paenibacillus methanolicus TaxID=582686 RepID=A0A5S5BZP4_9BACL|nr:methyl-accepting chemotaxis protein [Paenibacillus methanolicus]TYP72419.1 methyl-accepting chemotaxis protein [Paenibacillus methanolicus]